MNHDEPKKNRRDMGVMGASALIEEQLTWVAFLDISQSALAEVS
jgi:hypothetical protein